ncbi:regulatory protein, tetR family [Friedmanniella luteola]|uniref:Regulatory protein, tetR family n=1 Tax=Friedmanniella luteola TaxID=546871 RepID=A0A1H1M851_9ACTN|nr:TetR/AcrR family transcriptional regulator [Friedmanniella luteola]SDR82850.1 regulatory protein, tetR family [Friedmanniella luteola]
MPKLVDHEERRRDLARATWRVMTREGVGAVSVRTVAAEAGLSTGALRHYFPDQASLLLFAAEHTVERIGERMAAELADRDRAPIAVVQGLLEQLLPLDAEREAEVAVYFGLIDLTRLAPGHQDFRSWAFRESRRLIRSLVLWLAGGPEPEPELLLSTRTRGAEPLADPALEAQALMLQVLLDGLAVQGLLHPQLMDAATQRAVLRRELERVAGQDGSAAGDRTSG